MKINKEVLLGRYFDEAIENTKKIVAMPSYRRDLTKGSKLPQDTLNVLNYCIDLCKSWGLKTFVSEELKYGYADYGDGDKLFVIICHLDVVPPGNISEWINPPFEPKIIDDKLYGRGAFDDKGPTMMNLFAFKYLIDNGFKSNYKIRFIFGTCEETNWECMENYIANEKLCDLGYVPDGHFPVVYAEKWIADLDLIGDFKCNFEIIGGQAYNAVNDLVSYIGPKIDLIQNELEKINVKSYVENEILYVKGISAHGSLPFKGVSASNSLLFVLNKLNFDHPLIKFVANDIYADYEMKNIFGNLEDETGVLTACNGIIDINKKSFKYTLNLRIPCTRDVQKDVVEKLSSYLIEKNIKTNTVKLEDRVYFPKDSEVVTKMMSIYQEVTGDYKTEPIAIGGGTFAKSMPNIIAFGAEFDLNDSTMHSYNEYVKIEDLKKMIEIYAKSIVLLTYNQ
ncbi:Sapep family Mn(2+)-dependent dipeptidase [Spiroplasma tabanidicola]|uniref:Dipeptidase PepV n=1 Tax=Spiroplasma tabanidicola TaxID=324079 RepID=A0A6I6C9W5_9MOLU|nr:Sapep family Mn(2+)-dependent dipeptidase [Spiroplasma tabanidicola]QGS51691.1 dipeptidase PepV [Spiroplasma tabanidicola]